MLNIFFFISTLILISGSVYGSVHRNNVADPPVRHYTTSSMTDYHSSYDRTSVCGENKVYDSCPPLYPPLRCNVKEILTVCGMNPEPGSPLCEPGCRCADNYYLNASGDCITREECLLGARSTKCNSRSLGYSECINGGCTKWRCTDYGYVCVEKGPCEVGCACLSSYERLPSGTCMPADPCPTSKRPSTKEVMPQKLKPFKLYSQKSKSDMD